MTSSNTKMTLGELVASTPHWETVRASELLEALSNSENKAKDLHAFFEAAELWWADELILQDERRKRRHWLDDIAEEFLRNLEPAGVNRIVQEIQDIDKSIELLTDLVRRDAGRYLISDSLSTIAAAIGDQVPNTRPESESESWTTRVLRLIDLCGITIHPSERICAVLDPLPRWLVEEFLVSLGRLIFYDNYYRELAFALGLCQGAHIAQAVALANRTHRLTELVAVLARRVAEEQRKHVPPGALAPAAALTFLHRVQNALPLDRREPFRAFVESQRLHDHEVGRIIGAYLAAVPSNHEDVIDYLTRHGTRPRGRALASWGSLSVTTSFSGSMRASSVNFRGDCDPDAPSPDFYSEGMLTPIPAEKIVELIRSQKDPEFSLHYVVLFSDHPQFAEIAEAVVHDRFIVERWKFADARYATQIWTLLEMPAYKAPAFKALRWELFPLLLPKFEARFLERALFHIPDEYEGAALAEITARLQRSLTVSVACDLFSAVRTLGHEKHALLLDKFSVTELAQVPREPEALKDWLNAMCRLIEREPDVCTKILRAIDVHALRDLANHQVFSPREETLWTARIRLKLKTELVRHWQASEPGVPESSLIASANEDFNLMWCAGLETEPFGHNPDETKALGPSDEWMDVVSSAAPSLIDSYGVAMLRTSPSADDQKARQTVIVAGQSLVRWLRRQGIASSDIIWNAAVERIKVAADAGDVETAASVAALDLPGDPGKLRSLRESAVAEISSAMSRARVISYTGQLYRLLQVLSAAAPDLAERLSSPQNALLR